MKYLGIIILFCLCACGLSAQQMKWSGYPRLSALSSVDLICIDVPPDLSGSPTNNTISWVNLQAQLGGLYDVLGAATTATNNYPWGSLYDSAGAATAATNGYPWGSLYDAANAAKNATNNYPWGSLYDAAGTALTATNNLGNTVPAKMTNALNQFTGNLAGTATTATTATTASGGWPTTLWATNTPAGIYAAGGTTNTAAGQIAATEAPAYSGVVTASAGSTVTSFANGQTGTQSVVLSNSPTIYDPTILTAILGTPAANGVNYTNIPFTGLSGAASVAQIPTLTAYQSSSSVLTNTAAYNSTGQTNIPLLKAITLAEGTGAGGVTYTANSDGSSNATVTVQTNAVPTNIYASRIAFTLANTPTCTPNTNAASGLNSGGTANLSNATDMAGIIVITCGSGTQPTSPFLCTNTFSASFQTSLSNVPPEVILEGNDWNGLGAWSSDALLPGRLSAIVTTNQFIVKFNSTALNASHVYPIAYWVIPLK